MENKEEKKLHYLLIGYANSKTLEDSKRQWKEILEHINLELDKAREEGRREGSEITSRYISDFVKSESGKSGRKEILEYIDKLSKLKQ